MVYRFADRVRERAHIEVFGVLAKFRGEEVAAMRSLHPELLGPRPVSVQRAHGDVFTCDGKMRCDAQDPAWGAWFRRPLPGARAE